MHVSLEVTYNEHLLVFRRDSPPSPTTDEEYKPPRVYRDQVPKWPGHEELPVTECIPNAMAFKLDGSLRRPANCTCHESDLEDSDAELCDTCLDMLSDLPHVQCTDCGYEAEEKPYQENVYWRDMVHDLPLDDILKKKKKKQQQWWFEKKKEDNTKSNRKIEFKRDHVKKKVTTALDEQLNNKNDIAEREMLLQQEQTLLLEKRLQQKQQREEHMRLRQSLRTEMFDFCTQLHSVTDVVAWFEERLSMEYASMSLDLMGWESLFDSSFSPKRMTTVFHITAENNLDTTFSGLLRVLSLHPSLLLDNEVTAWWKQVDHEGCIPLQRALYAQHNAWLVALFQFLNESTRLFDMTIKTVKDQRSPLHISIETCNIYAVKQLILHGAPLHQSLEFAKGLTVKNEINRRNLDVIIEWMEGKQEELSKQIGMKKKEFELEKAREKASKEAAQREAEEQDRLFAEKQIRKLEEQLKKQQTGYQEDDVKRGKPRESRKEGKEVEKKVKEENEDLIESGIDQLSVPLLESTQAPDPIAERNITVISPVIKDGHDKDNDKDNDKNNDDEDEDDDWSVGLPECSNQARLQNGVPLSITIPSEASNLGTSLQHIELTSPKHEQIIYIPIPVAIVHVGGKSPRLAGKSFYVPIDQVSTFLSNESSASHASVTMLSANQQVEEKARHQWATMDQQRRRYQVPGEMVFSSSHSSSLWSPTDVSRNTTVSSSCPSPPHSNIPHFQTSPVFRHLM